MSRYGLWSPPVRMRFSPIRIFPRFPQRIGAALRMPIATAICARTAALLMGDFLTLVQHDLPVKVVVFYNGSLRDRAKVFGVPRHRDNAQKSELRSHGG